LTYDIIKAACDGDVEARNKIVEYYSDYIEELSEGDEDVRQALILRLLEEIPKFDCEIHDLSLCQVLRNRRNIKKQPPENI